MSVLLVAPTWATTTINKQFTPATIDPGSMTRFRISIFNSSLVPLTSAAVTDNLPTQMALSNPTNVTDTCGFTTLVAATGTQAIRLSGGTVPAGSGTIDGSCYTEFDVVSTTVGNWPNTIPANGPSNGFTPGGSVAGYQALENATLVTNTTLATATLSVRSLISPTGSKTFAPSPGLQGEPITLTLVLSNANAATTLPLTTFTDPLPSGMVVAPTPAATVSCTGTGAANGTVTSNAGDSTVVLSGGIIGAAGACTVTIKVVASTLSGTTQTFTNTVPANAIGNTRGLTSATFNKAEVVNSPITVAKSYVTSPTGSTITTPVPAGQEVWVRLDVSNTSTQNPINITSLLDTLPTGMVISSSTPTMDCVSAGAGTNGTITAVVGSGSFTVNNAVVGFTGTTRRCRIQVPVVAAAAGSYVNTLPVNAVVNTAGFASPTASATLTVNAQLSVAKTVSTPNAAPGQPVTFTVAISNYTGGAVSGVTFNDTLPNPGGYQMVVSNPNGFTASAGCVGGTFSNAPGSSSLSWSGGTVVAGSGVAPGVCTISFKANAPANAPLTTVFTNSIAAGAVTGTAGGNAVTNPTGSSVNVTMVAAASVSKTFAPTSVVQGGSSVLTITIANATVATLTNAALTDSLPTGMTIAAVPATSTTCAGGTVTAAPLGGSVSIAGATVPASGNCNFKVSVVGNNTGTLVNTIPANSLTDDQSASNPGAASANLTVTSGLTATKNFTPASVANGGVSQVDVRITNPSVTPFTNLSFTDGPMTNLAVANPANASTTCAGSPVITATPGTSTVTLTGATLAAGANCDVLFNVVTSGNPTNWTNSLPVGNITTAEGAKNTAAVSATLSKLTNVNVSINKSFNPVSVSAGQAAVLEIDLTNPVASPATVHNLSFSDALPSGMEVYSSPAVSTTCTNATVTAAAGSSTVSMRGGTLAAGSTCSVFVNVTSVRYLNLTNTIPAGAVTTTEALTNNLATTATLSTLQGLGVAKSFSPTSVGAGLPATLNLRLISTLDAGAAVPITLHNATFTDNLPAGLVVAPTPNASSACTGADITAVPGSSAITVTGISIAPGESCVSHVDVVATSLGTYVNVIPAGTVTTTEGYANQSDSQATLNVLLSPVVTKAFAPSTVAPGVSSTLTITLTNANATALTSASLLDTLPAGLTIAPTPNASTTCTGGAVAATAAGSTVQLTNGTVPASGNCTVQVDVRSNTPNSYVNTIASGALSTTQGVSNTAPASATLSVIGPPGVTKSFTPAVVITGQVSTLGIQLGNPNVVAATLTSALIDNLPANLVVSPVPNITGSCTLGNVTAAPGAGTVTLASGTSIPVGGCAFTVDVVSNTAATYTNTIPVGALQTSLGSNTTAGTAALLVNPPPATDLVVTKTDGVSTVLPGATVNYSVVVSNAGPLAANGATVSDPAVAGLTKTGVTCAASGGAVCPSVLDLPTLESAGGITTGAFPAGGVLTFTVGANVTALSGATLSNTASVAVPTGMVDSNPANNGATDTDTVLGVPDLALTKTHTGTFTQAGTGSFTLSVSNQGNGPTTGLVSVTDSLPTELTATAIAGSGWTCTLAPLACTRSDVLANGASYPPITLSVQIANNAGTPLTNNALVSTPGDNNPANDAAQDTVTVVAVPDLTLAKTASGTFLRGQPGGSFSLTVSNVGFGATSTLVQVSDALPTGLVATSMSGPGWTCTLAALTCSRADALAPGNAYPPILLGVSTASNAPGTLTNSATVSTSNDPNAANNTGSVGVSVFNGPDLTLTKTHTGAFLRGTSGTFTLTASNVGDLPTIGSVGVTDTLPNGFTATALSGTGWNCTLAPLACTRADALAAAGVYPPITLTVAIANDAADTLQNTATVAGGAETNTSNDSASDSVTMTGNPDLAITKTASGALVRGQTSGSFTLAVTNVGTSATTGAVNVTDTLPMGLAAVSVSGTGWTCTVSPVACTRADTLAPNAAYPDITVTVATAGNAATPLTNTANVTTPGDTNPTNNTASVDVTVYSGVDLTLVKTHSGNFLRGGSGTFTLTTSNVGDQPSTGVVSVTDQLPVGLNATAISGAGWTCDLPGLTCTRSDVLVAGAHYTDITVSVAVADDAPDSVVNTAVVSGGADNNPDNNTASDTVLPTGHPDLALTKTHVGNFTRGQTSASFSLTVNNVGTSPTTATVTVTDAMPAGLSATAITGSGWTCTLTPLACTRNDLLQPGDAYPAITLSVDVDLTAGNPLVNTATVATADDPNPLNDTANDSVTVNAGPDLTVSKTHTGTFIRGHQGSFTVSVSNVGDVPSSGLVSVTDPAGAGFTVTSLAGPGWTCDLPGVTCIRSDALAPTASYPDIVVGVAVDVQASSPLANTVSVSGGGDTNLTNNAATDTVTLGGAPDLAMTKSHLGNFQFGQVGAQFTLQVDNVGNAPTTAQVSVTDTMPAGLTATAISGAGWTCALVPLGCTRTDILANGASYPPIGVTVDVAANATTPLANVASVTTTDDPNPLNDVSTDTVSINVGPDLTLTKTHTGNFVRGGVGSFSILVSNAGDVASSGVVSVTDTLPGGLTATALAGSGWACDMPSLTCTRSDVLAPGNAYPLISVSVVVATGAPSPQVNAASVSGGGDNNPSNNSTTDSVTLAGGPQLALAKTHVGTFSRGQVGALYHLDASNVGDTATSGVVSVTDALPSGLTATAINGSGWTCVLASLTCNRADALAAGAAYPTLVLTVNVAVDAPATLVNSGTVSGGGSPTSSGMTASDTVALTGPDVILSKTHSGVFTLGGSAGRYLLVVSNIGAGATTAPVSVVDTLPPGLILTAMSGTGWSCNVATRSCTRSDVLAAGASYPGINLSVTVLSTAPPTLLNTASVATTGDTNPANNIASDLVSVGNGGGGSKAQPIPALPWPGLLVLGLLLGTLGTSALRRRR